MFDLLSAPWCSLSILDLEDVCPGRPIRTLPASSPLNVPKSPGMLVSWIGTGLEFKAPLSFQAHMPREISDVPKFVRLAFEDCNND